MKLFVLIVSPSVSFLFEITISVISYQLSVISYQLSVISYQLFSPCSLLPTSPLPHFPLKRLPCSLNWVCGQPKA
ncbi:unknown protein [Microcystis aeruginosa NIES-843]|uniref:Uncharacterized protein n=1 Tax=Microcystis aeruginosa (strain NIES-843 / IAM M-2473) TaxID=449447 RepID=B0JTG7_MICAN|nr:unknown protein [Microcystis aeruginosa NIES-843]